MRLSMLIIAVIAAPAMVCAAPGKELPSGEAAYQYFPPAQKTGATRDYFIGPLDVIAVNVFQEPDLTARDLQVDAGGNVVLPLIGSIHAAGLTVTELGNAIAQKLSAKMLVNPQVSVIVQQSVSQKVTVQGSVIDPGVYEIKGPTTLLDALAMARGPTRVAALSNVAVFREVQGHKVGAIFDVGKIQKGQANDPEILGSDTIVVGLSHLKATWRDVLTAAPLAAVLRPF